MLEASLPQHGKDEQCLRMMEQLLCQPCQSSTPIDLAAAASIATGPGDEGDGHVA